MTTFDVRRRGIVPYFFVTVTVIVTVIMILAMFIFYFCLKQQDKHCIKHYDFDYDCDYDKKIRCKYGPRVHYTPNEEFFRSLYIFDFLYFGPP